MLRKIEIAGNILSLIKSIIKKKKPIDNIIFNVRLMAFLLRLGTRQKCLLSALLFNTMQGAIKDTQIKKQEKKKNSP